MPKRARSGVPNLYKKHTAACRNREPLKCDCPWYGNTSGSTSTWRAGRANTWTRAGVSTRWSC